MFDVEATNAYIDAAKAGDASAKEKLLKDNENLIKSIVRRYLGKGVEYDDLYQLAGMGLLKAINGFDKSYGVRFSTYAVPMIAGEIKRFMRDDGSIKVSRSIKAAAKSINAYVEEYSAEHGVQPTIKDISQKFGMPPSEVVFTMSSSRMPLSLFAQSLHKGGCEEHKRLCRGVFRRARRPANHKGYFAKIRNAPIGGGVHDEFFAYAAFAVCSVRL